MGMIKITKRFGFITLCSKIDWKGADLTEDYIRLFSVTSREPVQRMPLGILVIINKSNYNGKLYYRTCEINYLLITYKQLSVLISSNENSTKDKK